MREKQPMTDGDVRVASGSRQGRVRVASGSVGACLAATVA